MSPTIFNSLPIIDQAMTIARHVAAHGGRALVVGGFVRDRLLGRESKDLDVEVYGIPEAELQPLLNQLGRVEPVGQAFPVYKLGSIDVALPRRESKVARGHKGFVVVGDPFMTPDDAARRRDFTINAIAWDPLTDAIVDPFDGQRDLRSYAARRRSDDVRGRLVAGAAGSTVRGALRADARRRGEGAVPGDRAGRSSE